jgi:surface antigen
MGNKHLGKSSRPAIIRLSVGLVAAFAAVALLSPPAAADPPPWAPAHGYRAKKKGKHKRAYRERRALPPGLQGGRCRASMFDSATVGTLIGAAAGGYAGSHVGKGDGKLAATAIGTLLGALVGHQMGASLARPDEMCFNQAFEHAPDRETITWRTDRNSPQYQVTPTKTTRSSSGQYCREYTAKAAVGGKTSNTYGTACRQPDGSWKLIN